jgi:mercuric ion transport protein
MTTGKLMSAGVFTAIAASLCCITPVLALIAGSGSIACRFRTMLTHHSVSC